MPDRSAYMRQIDSARNIGLAMTGKQLEDFIRILEEYADELAARVLQGVATRGDRHALSIAREILQQMSKDLAASLSGNVRITARRVAEMHASATVSLAAEEIAGLRTLFAGIGTRAAQAVLARPALSASFRSIRSDSVKAVDEILKRHLLRGTQRSGLAMELRLHVLGSEALPDRLLLDRRRIGYDAIRSLGYEPTRANLEAVRKQAGQVAAKARLIARTEPMNAELEAAVRSAIESPVVEFIRWKLSGRHPHEDACDALQDGDWYGFGPGLYDPRNVPSRPHPRCICLLLHVLKPVERWGEERGPLPRRILDVDEVAAAYGFTPSVHEQLAAVLSIGDRRRRVA